MCVSKESFLIRFGTTFYRAGKIRGESEGVEWLEMPKYELSKAQALGQGFGACGGRVSQCCYTIQFDLTNF